jgi:hypothetical protein
VLYKKEGRQTERETERDLRLEPHRLDIGKHRGPTPVGLQESHFSHLSLPALSTWQIIYLSSLMSTVRTTEIHKHPTKYEEHMENLKATVRGAGEVLFVLSGES